MRFAKYFLGLAVAGLLSAGAVSANAAPVGTGMFVVMDNNGALVTKASLAVGELISRNGIAYTVELVHPIGSGAEEIILSPRLPAGTSGPLTFVVSPASKVNTATTSLVNRPDSDSSGYWADDNFTRTFTLTRTGNVPGHYTYTATLKDSGTFTTIHGAATPNQSGSYFGETIGKSATGSFNGTAVYSFMSSKLANTSANLGIVSYENDHKTVPSDSTSFWYELAFPSGTTFSPAPPVSAIADWSWTYKYGNQQWIDSYVDGGSSPSDGNISA